MAAAQITGSQHYDIPYTEAVAITAGATPFAPTRALYVGGAGSVTVTMLSGTSVAFGAVPAGTTIQIGITAFTAGSATSVVALY
jgi:hypothetical protein